MKGVDLAFHQSTKTQKRDIQKQGHNIIHQISSLLTMFHISQDIPQLQVTDIENTFTMICYFIMS